MAKISNIDQMKQLLAGEHKLQQKRTFGWEPQKHTRHEVGDTWEEYDENGKVKYIWEQKDGYQMKHRPGWEWKEQIRKEQYEYPNCYSDCEKRITKDYTRLDKKFQKTRGMCFDCLIRFEADLKNKGKFEEYEQAVMAGNALSYFKEIDNEIKTIADEVGKGIEYVNVEGDTEKWSPEPEAAKKILEEYGGYKKNVLLSLGLNLEEEE